MATVTLHTMLSVDGVMQAPGGPREDTRDGFGQGGWVVPYADEDMRRWTAEWFAAADGFLLGRRTYEIFAAYWPQVTDAQDPVASRLNTLPKYVVSTTLERLEWRNSTLLSGRLTEAVAELKARPGRELQIHGSGLLARSLLNAGLVDEYRLMVFPVVLGHGRRLFAEDAAPTALTLVESRTSGSGIACHVYRPAGEPEYGSFD